MKTITVGFSRGSNMFSKLIMWATRSNISHTYIRLDPTIVYQASGLYVNETTYEDFLTYETVVKEIQLEVSDQQFASGEAFRIASLDKPYSIPEIVGFAWIFLMRMFGKKVANPLRDGNTAYVCVKLVCKYAGIDDAGENMTPEDLYLLLRNQTVKVQ